MTNQTPHPHWDNATKRIFGFFVAKHLLFVQGIRPAPTIKLDLEEVIRVGLEVEPRILEVLPAALLRFPKTFLNWDKMPEKVAAVLDAIRKDKKEGPELGGIPFKDMKRWANRKLPDTRSVPVNEQRIMVSFRLSPQAIKKLNEKASQNGKSKTDVLEELLLTGS